ncbi:MAG: toxic anion resistance protein, partial [Pseudomonadota bacterium]
MSETVRQKAEEDLALVKEVSEALLPEPKTEIVPLATADPAMTAEIEQRIGEIDMMDTNSIVSFGS